MGRGQLLTSRGDYPGRLVSTHPASPYNYLCAFMGWVDLHLTDT
jgi:hypothetical protein